MRIEQTQDVDRIRPLAEQWLAECHAQAFGMAVTLEAPLAELRQSFDVMPGTILLAFDGVELVGFFAVVACPSFLSAGTVALEKYWYARPNAARAGPALYRAAQQWAQEQGCAHLIVSASNIASGLHDKVCRFCEQMGMAKFETAYIAKIKGE